MEIEQATTQEVFEPTIEDMIQTESGIPTTTSLVIAQVFDKEHKNVLRDIQNLECSPQFRQLNFELYEYSKELDIGVRKYPAYRLTRDGFVFLAMGFTGKKAAAWKERFLEAFNTMEAALLRQQRQRETARLRQRQRQETAPQEPEQPAPGHGRSPSSSAPHESSPRPRRNPSSVSSIWNASSRIANLKTRSKSCSRSSTSPAWKTCASPTTAMPFFP